jgi:DNA-directed RNA polymerase specialized sigma subunit
MMGVEDTYSAWAADQTPENMALVIDELKPAINAEVYRYPGPKPLLRVQAKRLATKAVRSYDPARGAKLRSWVVTQLQPLSRYGKQLRPVHVSEVAVRQAAEVNRLRQQLSDTLGREPTHEELADEVGISVPRIKKLEREVMATTTEGRFVNEEGVPTLPATSEADTLSAAADGVYESLSKRDRGIYDWKTGQHGKPRLPNQEIARRLGVSPALISQRTAQISEQIADAANRGLF